LQYIFAALILSVALYGDMIKNKTLGCPSIDTLKKSLLLDPKDPMALELYSMSNSCVILTRNDSVEALGFDPRNSKDEFQEIIYKKTNTQLFILRSAITVEQGGKKNTYRF